MITYLIKTSACVALFYLVYSLFFRHTTRFQLNRVYLVAGLLLSFVIPLIVVESAPINIPSVMIDDNVVMDNLQTTQITGYLKSEDQTVINLYLLGAITSLLATIVSVSKPIKLYLSLRNNHNVIIDPSAEPFSFFGVLFIRPEEDPIIVEHEMVHIRQRHWIDLIIIEVAAIILWFNPVIYLYRRSIAIQHEYIADRQVVRNVPVENYLDCLAAHLESNIYKNLANGFNTRSIKQRIIMITETKHYSMARYAIVLPLIAFLSMAFATKQTEPTSTAQNQKFRSPVDATKLTPGEGAGFGKRFNPATNNETFHTGVDFVLEKGNKVFAVSDGVVVSASNAGSYGNLIVIEHTKELRTSSAHLETILVKPGEKIKAGQVIGTVGSTGASTGPHLHFEVIKKGKAVDPAIYFE